MIIYNIVLFLHITGAIGYFVAISTWLVAVVSMRRTQHVEPVRALLRLMGLLGPLFAISVLLILSAGLYMALTMWNLTSGWILVGLISLILIAPLGTALIEPRRRAIDRLASEAPAGPLPSSLEQHIHDPVLLTSVQTVLVLLLGVVFLMTTKLGLVGSLIVMGVALLLGLASGLLLSQRGRLPRRGRGATPERDKTLVG
jgi:hypothetical protein